MIKGLFAATILLSLATTVPGNSARAQAVTQQEKTAVGDKKQEKERRAQQKIKAREDRKKARRDRIESSDERSATHRKAVEARHQKMLECTAKWGEQKKSSSDKSRRAHYAFMKSCQSE